MNMNNEQLRKIDELIATKIMGWQKEATLPEYFFWKDVENGELKYHIDDWKPSTNIKYAWEVVEKIIEQLGSYSLTKIKDGGHYCEVLYWNHGAFDVIAEVEAETAPLAICLAALKAVGADIKKEVK